MENLKWLDSYSGQTVDELISLEGEYRIDSLVLAFEQAIQQKASRVGEDSLTSEERIVLSVEALEREVNNGGYDQFFINSTHEVATLVVDALLRIGCPATAEITRRALAALELSDLGAQPIDEDIHSENRRRDEELGRCDELYYQSSEDIAAWLFAFIRTNKHAFEL